jgi:predicted Zn-dependent protease with MMP-like domain
MARDYDELIDEAYEALEESRFQEALEIGRQAIDTDPECAPGHYLSGAALVEMRHAEIAIPYLRQALDLDPDYPDARFCLASAQFATGHFSAARHELRRILKREEGMADAHYSLGLCLERQSLYEEADASILQACKLAPDRFHQPVRLARSEFELMVRQSMAMLPAYFRQYLESIEVLVSDLPDEDLIFASDPFLDPEMFGMFQGTPLVERSLMDTMPTDPDCIHLFQRNIERYCKDQQRLLEETRVTLLHEVGHAMGLDDEGLSQLGYE